MKLFCVAKNEAFSHHVLVFQCEFSKESKVNTGRFIGKVCVCNIAWTVQCRQEDTIVGQSPGAQPQLKIKLLLSFTSCSAQSIVTVGRTGGEPL